MVAEKINKNERKSLSEIILASQGVEPDEFWDKVHGGANRDVQQWVPDNWEPPRPILYKVGLGMGYLELPQGILIFYAQLKRIVNNNIMA